MGYVRSRKFCCCIPVRFWVFILSILGMGGGVILSVFGWWSVAMLKEQMISTSKSGEIALYISSAIYTILVLLSLFGFIGSIIKNIRMVAAFAIALLIHFGLNLGSGIYTLYMVFKQDLQEVFQSCIGDSTGKAAEAVCRHSFTVVKAVITTVFIVVWLLQLYAYFIVLRYEEQLQYEDSLKRQVIATIGRPPPINVTTYSAFGGAPAPPKSASYPRSAFVNGNNRV